jgi:hypothetical protein
VLACGRRWGKTDAAAADTVARIVRLGSSRQLAIAPSLAQARIVFERVKWFLAAAGLAFTSAVTPHPSIRVSADDNKKTVLHVMDARSGHEASYLRGEGADHVLIDEAAYVPEPLITEVAMPMLAANDGGMTLISTPRGRNHFYRYFARGQAGASGFWSRSGPSEENPLVSAEYLALQGEILSDRAFRTEYHAEFLDSDKSVFDIELIERGLEANYAVRGSLMVGVDWARSGDYTAVAAVKGTRRNAEVIACESWHASRWLRQIERVAAFCRELRASRVVCDATGAGSVTTEQIAAAIPEIPVDEFVFTAKSKAEIIDGLVWMLEHNSLRLLADPDLLREMETFESVSVGGRVSYGAPSGLHDDRVCALALACSLLHDGLPVGVLSKGRRLFG